VQIIIITGNSMTKYQIIANATFGLEAVLNKEIKDLGYHNATTENGRIIFEGDALAVARANIFLRTAERIFIRLARFEAKDFDQLFDNAGSIPWGEMIPQNGIMHVVGKSVKSKLHSVPACQGMVKKSIIEAMKRHHKVDIFPENGPLFKIEISINNDIAEINLDTTGAGLHRRGYRDHTGEAPMKETLAAGLLLLSRWHVRKPLIDPFCGSGTILIEAAMLAKNIAPGLNRSFISQKWDFLPKTIWRDAGKEAINAINDEEFLLEGYDIDERVLQKARDNAENAEVDRFIHFQKRDALDLQSSKKDGVIITNPPYGERLGTEEEINKLYHGFGKTVKEMQGWSIYILTAHPTFQETFSMRAHKKRKLFNGNLKCNFYQYFGNKR